MEGEGVSMTDILDRPLFSFNQVLELFSAPREPRRMSKATPATPGAMRARYYDRPDLFNPDGSWRPDVDRYAIHPRHAA